MAKRLIKEYKDFIKNPESDVFPEVSEGNLFLWNVLFLGTKNTPFEVFFF